MPRTPINYANTIIYKLCCKNPEIKDEYIGSTTNISKRKQQHKTSCNNPNVKDYNYKVYQFIRENGGWENWSMVMVEDYKCENKLQACQRERYWIETLKSSLNTVIPLRTKQEWNESNKDKIAEQKKEYQLQNKDKIAEQNKQRYLKNKLENQDL